MIQTHLRKLRATETYRTAVIFMYIEANMSYITANQMRTIAEKPEFYPMHVETFDPTTEERAGVWTGEDEKHLYALEMKSVLLNGALWYASDFITSDPINALKTEVREQMGHFRREFKMMPNGKLKVTYTGKSNNRKDDVCIVIQMLLHWSKETRESQTYMDAAAANGWRW